MATRKKPKTDVVVDIDFGPLDRSKLTTDQIRRLLAHVGNHVVSWIRYDVQDTHDIAVTSVEGEISWRSDTGEFGKGKK